MKVGIVGYGFVGKAMCDSFLEKNYGNPNQNF